MSLSSAAGVFLRAVTTATCLPAPMNSEGQASAEILRNVTNVVVVIVLVRRNRRGRCRCMRPRFEQLPGEAVQRPTPTNSFWTLR